MSSNIEIDRIAGALKDRGVRRLAYFHTDHFEPWRNVPGRAEDPALSVGDVEAYAEAAAKHDFARRATLFMKSNINFAVDDERELYRADPNDRLGFLPRSEEDRATGRAILAPLVAGGHELQIHIHHENFVWNGSLRDPSTRDYLDTPSGREFGPARLELAVRLNLELLREDGGGAFDRWFFIHGHWALNASDTQECTVVREIEMLMRNGCLGDFTQPAGRPHVDSRINEPYLALPVAEAKGYDTAAARPIQAAGNGHLADGRFFLWATALTHGSASIDIYSKAIARRAEQRHILGLAQARNGVVIGDTLYVKTHGHSMAPAYWEGGLPFPHAHPKIQAELQTLFEAAGRAGAEIAFPSTFEVYDEILSGPATPPLRGLPPDEAHPMEDQGVTVVHTDAGGVRAAAPALPLRPVRIAPPIAIAPEPAPAEHVHEPLPEIASLQSLAPPPPPAPNEPSELTKHAALVNRAASRVALFLAEEGEADQYGVTGYYITRAREGTTLQPAEIQLVAELLKRHRPGTPVWELGCGLGVLTTLLAAAGFAATGLDRNEGRVEVARTIARQTAEDGLAAAAEAEFLVGIFPKAVERHRGLAGAVALVTNLLGSADEAAQARFIRGLRRFDRVMIDLQRFFTRRASAAEQAELIAMFRKEGFPEPEPLFSIGTDGNYVVFGRARLPLTGKQAWAIRADRWRTKKR